MLYEKINYEMFQVQYCFPIIIVSISYAMICRKLKFRLNNSTVRSSSSRRVERDDKRMKKTNKLLITIALIFCLSWLPLNLYNLVVDFYNPFGDDMETMLVVYAGCHMMGMSSACSNPLMYGWLNDNFHKEFHEIFSLVLPCYSNTTTMQMRHATRGLEMQSRKSQGNPLGKEDRSMVMYTKTNNKQRVTSNDRSQKDVTYITQMVTSATL